MVDRTAMTDTNTQRAQGIGATAALREKISSLSISGGLFEKISGKYGITWDGAELPEEYQFRDKAVQAIADLRAGAILAALCQPPEASEVEAVVTIGKDWRLLWSSQDTLSTIVERTGIKIGDKLYAHPPKASPMQGLDEDWFADVLYDSLDMDWDVRTGAKAIMRALESRAKPDAYGLLNSARHIDVREEDADLIAPPKVEASEGM